MKSQKIAKNINISSRINLYKKNPKQASGTARFETGLRKNHLWLAGILAITLIAFLPAVRNLFITFDDMEYVVENPFIKGFSMSNLRAIFLGDANNLGNYHPLTLLSYIVNYSFSELHPAAYHLTNILVHLANTLLVFQLSLLLFARLGTPREKLLSAMTALLFGIHPLHVESVAWVSERKDLMYTCFYCFRSFHISGISIEKRQKITCCRCFSLLCPFSRKGWP